MGHQIHFLQRSVQRFAPDHRRFALSLYYDQPLVEATLQLARLPPQAERLAIDLGSNGRGPYLVLTRTGHFVTCLAVGMSVANLPVIPRSKLLVLLDRAREQRRRERLEASRGGLNALVKRVFDLRLLAREDFDALSAHVPKASIGFLVAGYQNWATVEREREALLAEVNNRYTALPVSLRVWSNQLRALGPLLTLATLDPVALTRQMPARVANYGDRGAHRAYTGLRQGVFDIAAQALWSVGRQGKRLWNPLAKTVRRADSRLAYVASAAGLCTAALRFPQHLPATRHLLLNSLEFAAAGDLGPRLSALHAELAPIWEEILYFPDLSIESQAEVGHRLLAKRAEQSDGQAKAPSRELALTAAVQLNRADFLNDGAGLVELLRCIPWLAAVDARELYLPESELFGTGSVWTMEDSRETLDRWLLFWGKRDPDVRKRIARPNDPCPCGSRRKFKKCCDTGPSASSEGDWWARTERAA